MTVIQVTDLLSTSINHLHALGYKDKEEIERKDKAGKVKKANQNGMRRQERAIMGKRWPSGDGDKVAIQNLNLSFMIIL